MGPAAAAVIIGLIVIVAALGFLLWIAYKDKTSDKDKK